MSRSPSPCDPAGPDRIAVADRWLPLRTQQVVVAGDPLDLLVIDPAAEEVLLEAAIQQCSDNPYFGRIWPAAQALAEELVATGAPRGRTVVELGCGPGLAGLVAARLGASVTLTDVSQEALELAARNAQRLGLGVSLARLDLRAAGAIGRFDLVLASDLLYESWQPDALAAALDLLLTQTGQALIADPYRLTADRFRCRAEWHGLVVEQCERGVVAGEVRQAIRLFVVRRGAAT